MERAYYLSSQSPGIGKRLDALKLRHAGTLSEQPSLART
jgi:hypothetical protein